MSSNSVLGHYPLYVEVADMLGASRFSVPPALWFSWLQTGNQWSQNVEFLSESIRKGRIITTTPPIRARPGSAFAAEIAYLVAQGYPISSSQTLSLL